MDALLRPALDTSRALDWFARNGLVPDEASGPGRRRWAGLGLYALICLDRAEVGRCLLFDLERAAAARRSSAICVAAGGFTLVAHDWADRRQVALFGLDIEGGPVPLNAAAQELVCSGRLVGA